jgi:hypothetical protein
LVEGADIAVGAGENHCAFERSDDVVSPCYRVGASDAVRQIFDGNCHIIERRTNDRAAA